MGVTHQVTDVEMRQAAVHQLVNSHTLHGSESLCKLLRYLADQSLKHPGAALKEYQIATEVFGRAPDFDPHLDSLVRVQAGRLRSKLGEYYAAEGADDNIIVELPKGTYSLTFHLPAASTTHRAAAHPVQEAEPVIHVGDAHNGYWPVVVLSILLTAAIGIIAFFLLTRSVRSENPDRTPAALRLFWQQFISGRDEPWVIFSNGAFVGRPETGLRYFNSGQDSRKAILDHYTGVGEVLAVYNLDHVFSQLHRDIRVKRGSLFTLDDAENNNLIFVGSPAENLTLVDLPSTHEFIFQRPRSGARKGDLAILNLHPQPGEPKLFFANPSGTPLNDDYAIVGLVPGMNPAHWVLILAGTTTLGTQAAAEYVCRQDSLQQLLLRLSVSENGAMKPFEAVLHVKVARGVPIATELAALREVSR
ncbi:MAG: helix-turn-helix domain-containing protein [Acidobacteria bacterium]|nr:helix-turn-helix domain-containing protein [Acidobacteriota bacterium]